MKFVFSLSPQKYIAKNEDKISKLLPPNITFIKENDLFNIAVELPLSSNEEQARYLIQRELNRVLFYTGMLITYKYEYVKHLDGKKIRRVGARFDAIILSDIPENASIQIWKDPLAIQLDLWRIAHMEGIPVISKINLLFQIIEATYPEKEHYPDYLDSSLVPDKRTECKLLRHLVSHQGEVSGIQLKNYCSYLGYPESFFDPSDVNFYSLISSKVNLVRDEARRVIVDKISP